MKISDFFAHHGINRNPFAEEDAQSDKVFQTGCIDQTRHPAWDKIYGDPSLPSTSVVFGEKGSGKTALRLQMARSMALYNEQNPNSQVFVIEYDDFNPFLDRFFDRYPGAQKKPEKYLKRWKLWDHIDAILSLGVTRLTDQALQVRGKDGQALPELDLRKLDENQRRDFLLLAALYDHSTADADYSRWIRLRRKLGVFNLAVWKWTVISFAWFFLFLGIALATWHWGWHSGTILQDVRFFVFLLIGAIPLGWQRLVARWRARKLWKNLRTQQIDKDHLRRILLQFTPNQLSNQPLPMSDRSDDRYALLSKFANILNVLGYKGIVVLVDRVDEPYLINGSADLMRDLVWPALDNKLLKHQNIGFKLLLPEDLYSFVQREGNEFRERSRLDKQNLIPALEWTGQSLYDLANARLKACTDSTFSGKGPETLDQLFDSSLDRNHLISSLQQLRGPRNLFKFLHELLVSHTDSHTDQNPCWEIAPATFDATLREYQRRM